MKPIVETVRISEKGRDILIKIKRRTGIHNWNILCRIAYIKAISTKKINAKIDNKSEKLIEMDWKTFVGKHDELISSLTYYKANQIGIDINNKKKLTEFFRNHLEFGIYNLNNMKTVKDLLNL